jgi:hypothetical protein
MRIKQIVENSTTSGSISTVAMPLMKQTRESVDVPGLKPVSKVMTGKAKKKGPYANSLVEGKMKDLSIDLRAGKDGLSDEEFKKKYGKTKEEMRNAMRQNKPQSVAEATLEEDDIILNPRTGRLRRSGFLPHDREPEGHTLKNSLHTIIRVATHLDKALSTQDDFPEWVSEKIGAVKSNMVTVMNYLISSQEMQHDNDAMEGAKVDRMVQHVKKSEKKLGHSDKEAENIAWATANKRGMLDNKNKKK